MGVYCFEDPYKKIFKVIVKPIIETHSGLTYVDALTHYEPILTKMDLISRLIANAKLVIVDISMKNPNVFLELGLAYAYKKPIILLCSNDAYINLWQRKMPFDTEGKELIIYENDGDLKVKLGRSISDCLSKTSATTLSWISTNPRNQIKSACELDFYADGEFWSSLSIQNNFIMSYHVIIHEFDEQRNPDLRLFFSPTQNGYPRISIIFPWELSEIDPDKYECHIDFLRVKERFENAKRLQQIPVCIKHDKPPLEFDIFVSFYYPNLVFESTLFDNEIDRLVVSINQFQQLEFPTHFNQFIGFKSAHKISISAISVKEVFL